MSQKRRKVVFSDEETPIESKTDVVVSRLYRILNYIRVRWDYLLTLLIVIGVVYKIVSHFYRFTYRTEILADEIRSYIYLFIGFTVAIIFALLRLYNAMIQNTTAVYKLKKSTDSNTTELKAHIKSYGLIAKSFEASVKSCTKAIESLVTIIKSEQ